MEEKLEADDNMMKVYSLMIVRECFSDLREKYVKWGHSKEDCKRDLVKILADMLSSIEPEE